MRQKGGTIENVSAVGRNKPPREIVPEEATKDLPKRFNLVDPARASVKKSRACDRSQTAIAFPKNLKPFLAFRLDAIIGMDEINLRFFAQRSGSGG